MKTWIASFAGLAWAGLVLAQPAPKPAPAKPGAKSPAPASAKARPSPSRTEIRSLATQMAAGIEAAEAALTPAELAIAERVHVGRLPCELGTVVIVTADPKSPGYFDVQAGKARYRMFPVASRTGAIRLEDRKSEALWLQLANKSMLINRKLGQRMADACMSPQQTAVAAEMERNPAPSVLDAPTAPASAATATATATPAAPASSATAAAPGTAPASAAPGTAPATLPTAAASAAPAVGAPSAPGGAVTVAQPSTTTESVAPAQVAPAVPAPPQAAAPAAAGSAPATR